MGTIGRIIGTVATGGLLMAAPDIMKAAAGKTKAPVLEKPLQMPEIDDEKIMLTRKRSMIAQQQRDGRASTMLSDSYDKLG